MPRFTEILEAPVPKSDWRVSEIVHQNEPGEDTMVWWVRLVKVSDGTRKEATCEDLFVAWCRATAAAEAHDKGIFRD